MGSTLDLFGLYVPLVTPFTTAGKVSFDDLAKLSHHYLDAGARGLIALGTTGEPATLSADERAAVVSMVSSICAQREAQFIVGLGTSSTADTVAMVEGAASIPGLTAIMTVVPYYTRPSEAGIVAHFQKVAKHSPVPVIAYNVPYRTGRGLGGASLLELASTPNIAGLKQAVGGVDLDTVQLMAERPDDFAVLCGDDAFIYSLLGLGGSGAIAASSHHCIEGFVELIEAHRIGDAAKSRAIAEALLPVCEVMFCEPSPAVIKGVLAARGLIATPDVRMPMTTASPEATQRAVDIVETVNARLQPLLAE